MARWTQTWLPICLLRGMAIGTAIQSLLITAVYGEPARPPAAPATVRNVREYAPGVRIDWDRQVVEVDASVVLRSGALELLACSPQTREHESILVVRARPFHIYQAMGLIGLEPGSPHRYEPQIPAHGPDQAARGAPAPRHMRAATGASLSLRVRFLDHGVVKTMDAGTWLLDNQQQRVPDALEWVFAGSRALKNGVFGADEEGTVVCVVDFATALIAVGASHTSDDESLWLSANTAAIPPIGTACTLLIGGTAGRTSAVVLVVEADGSLRREGKAIAPSDVVGLLHRGGRGASDASVLLRAAASVSDSAMDAIVQALTKAGVERRLIEVEHPRNHAHPVPTKIKSPQD
ncbi:MAG: YdjY domain-containing protein [Phycisphaerae bacterium]